MTREELRVSLRKRFITGQAKFEDLQASDSDDEEMKANETY